MGTTHALRVMIADSDPHLRQLLFSALLAVDVYADCVSSVGDALEKFCAESYGVVLLDIALPGNPEHVVASIARMARDERPVVLVTASNPLAGRTLDGDVVQIVLRKPIALRQTVALIQSCLRSVTIRPAALPDGDHATS